MEDAVSFQDLETYKTRLLIFHEVLTFSMLVETFNRRHFEIYQSPTTFGHKQCKPRSDATECGVKAGSTLFKIRP